MILDSWYFMAFKNTKIQVRLFVSFGFINFESEWFNTEFNNTLFLMVLSILNLFIDFRKFQEMVPVLMLRFITNPN